MARRLLLLFIVGYTFIFSGCITSYTPKESVVEMNSGVSHIFTAVSDDATARLVWYLDGRRVVYGQTQFTYNAEQNNGSTIITHQLVVREEGGRYALYYKYAGAPAPSVTWTIRIMPSAGPEPCYLDEDGDGFGDVAKMVQSDTTPANCLQDNADCNDDDANVHPGATEVCGDAIDQDCSGADEVCPADPNDVDGDGDGLAENQGDCNDANAAIYAGATEICGDGIDQDCSGADAACPPGPNDTDDDRDSYTENQGDCNDGNASIYPGASDVCGDGVDQDCSGSDEICPPDPNNSDDDNDGYTENQGDCNDSNPAAHPGAVETCNNIDDNCDGQVDEGVQLSFYRDADGDAYGNAAAATQACVAPAGYVTDNHDCDDAVATVHPNATEICNNIDEDCDGQTDEGVLLTFYQDGDRDTFGNLAITTQACAAPSGYVTNAGDCDDTRDTVNPVAAEVCNNADDNCNGTVDDGIAATATACGIGACASSGESACVGGAMVDSCQPGTPGSESCDGIDNNCNGTVDDGIAATATTCGIGACASSGELACVGGAMVDSCQPGTPSSESCDAIDNNCDGSVDEGVLLTFYRDSDGDSFGNAGITTQACATPSGYVDNSTDCNDNQASIYPGAAETCNYLDEDCDGTVDEGVQLTFYADADGDGHGKPASASQACAAPANHVASADDCDDTNAGINPGAVEACNQIDDNCDLAVDEGDVCVVAVPAAPLDVVASDIASGRTDIQVAWSASNGAEFYRVYRAIYSENGNYVPVGDHITGTSFVYAQDFTADVLDQVGAFPQGDEYLANLEAYREQIKPYLFDFKAPAFFKVEACNVAGCSDLSAADAGQAEFIHTATYSEVAQMIIPLWFHPVLVTFGSLPGGTAAMSWCGIDICGPAGGMYMGRLNGTLFSPQLDVYYENYTDGWMNHQAARFWVDGYLGGRQPNISSTLTIRISGNFDATFGAIQARLFSYFSIPLTSGENDGYITVTYKGAAYQFLLPINAETAEIALLAPLDPARNDADYTVSRTVTAYPVPFSDAPLTVDDCLWSDDLVVQCDRIPN